MSDVVRIGSEILVDPTNAGKQDNPRIIPLAAGGFVVVWGHDYQTRPGVGAQIFTADGTPIGSTIGVAGRFEHSSQFTALASGGFVVTSCYIATSADDIKDDVYARVFTADGTQIGREISVVTADLDSQLEPQITALANGGFVVTWTDFSHGIGGATGDEEVSAVKAQIFTADGTRIGTEILVNTATAGYQGNPQIAALPDGGFVVTWTDFSRGVGGASGDASGSAIKAQVFAADGTRNGAEILVNTTTAEYQHSQHIIALASGGFVVTWLDSAASPVAQIFTADGTKVGDEIPLKAKVLPDLVTPLADGGFVVTWADTGETVGDSSGLAIKMQVFTADGISIGAETRVNTATDADQRHPQVTALETGGFVVTWEDASQGTAGAAGDASGTAIKAQAFAADGTPIGAEILVNTTTDKDQIAPRITALANGGFVVTWNDPGEGGGSGAYTVKAQVFGFSEPPAAIVGTSDNDRLIGTPGDDVIQGLAGDDISTGGAGMDRFTIGADAGLDTITDLGMDDKIDFTGVVFDSSLRMTWLSTADGVQTYALVDTSSTIVAMVKLVGRYTQAMFSIEEDGSGHARVGLHQPPRSLTNSKNFDGDSFSDILLQRADGQAAVWQMNGTDISSGVFVGPNPGTSWKAIDTGDFNGDGKCDMLFQNADGQVGIWELDRYTVLGSNLVGHPGASWKAIDTGDFNDDGKSDILLRHDDGAVAVWELDGARIIGASIIGVPDPSWHAIGSSDVNGDGKSDVLLGNENGAVAVWELDATTIVRAAIIGVPGASWHAVGTGDFDGDGKSDVLFQDIDGIVGVWKLDGTTLVEAGLVASPGPSWHAIDTGDLNGDGKSDIVLQHDNGTVAVWELDSTSILGAGIVGAPGVDWLVV